MAPNITLTSNQEAAQAALRAAEARFIANNPQSKAQHDLAVGTLPGGNTRTLLHTSPFPLSMKQGKDAYVWDVDGHKYLDLVGELSAGLFGHSHPLIRQTLLSTIDDVGLSLGATTPHEHTYAALLCARFGLARVRMANTGTEANLHALAGARHFTRRRKVVVFAGGYHGAVLAFGGEGGVAAAGGNTVDVGDFVVVSRYNDLALAREVIAGVGGALAAVLVEGMQGAGGCIPGGGEFLRGVQAAAREQGGLFILDEVMTSRLAPNGLGAELGLTPDLDVMAVYDPRVEGTLAHSGTFNNNTLVMRVGYAALNEVFTAEVCVAFNEKGERFRERLREVARGSRLSFTGRGSLIGLHFTEDGTEEIDCGLDVKDKRREDLRDLFWLEMLEAGFWTTRRGFIAMILGTPDEELDRFVEAVRVFLERHRAIMVCDN
ncbi:pyridoxal phosphate-dependent transferase [Chaetomidium leptoderma]|uniref:Pyridoxal phosphate-dependent transferase n=1 Tax=Chaetomidium leptoderma TaxID=669021 RepID=A0AAN6VJ42_9PEZI|nr:pyridoxal phosphate-dependent transferase [Chaetomidium leptoderma]